MSQSTHPTWWPTLAAVPRDMAQQVATWLPSATVESYQAFLNMMYHYTLGSEQRLRDAAALTPDPALRDFYLELAQEEAPHYELARRDLASFGLQPRQETPAEVARFQAMWSGVQAADHVEHLGALFALESVADHLARQAVQELGRLALGPEQASFVLVHLEADEVHGDLCQRHCARVGQQHAQGILRGAGWAGECWVQMHRCLAG